MQLEIMDAEMMTTTTTTDGMVVSVDALAAAAVSFFLLIGPLCLASPSAVITAAATDTANCGFLCDKAGSVLLSAAGAVVGVIIVNAKFFCTTKAMEKRCNQGLMQQYSDTLVLLRG